MRSRLILFVLASFATQTCAAQPAHQPAIVKQWCDGNIADLETLYRELHAAPELSFQEEKTAARFASELQQLGAVVTTQVGGHGVVALLANGEGPTLMLRTDLDGLPVTEQTRLAYSSQVRATNEEGVEVGVMHACGHDIHMTNLIGTARFLSAHRDAWRGTVMFIGQPAEERGAGAQAMLEDRLFERFPKPDFALALHVDATLATGKIGYRTGYALANVDSVDIHIKGRGGHGAYPHATIDPIVQAAQLVLALQTIVSREIKPTAPAVVTVGSIHGGTKHNVISDSCHLQLTVRSYADDVRSQILSAIRRKARAAAASMNAPEPAITVSEGTPALWNDEDLAARVIPAMQQEIGAENVINAEASMGGEDFSRYGQAGVPILMYRLGTVAESRLARFQQLGQQPPSLHSALYYPDARDALTTGIRTMARATLALLPVRE
jgi:hippurate hydrolase